MHARSALFDLYGDHLRARGARAPVAALVRLLAPLGVQPPAVRTAVSRMVRQGWLEPVRTDGQPGYALTARARRRLDDAAARIYRTEQPGDGSGGAAAGRVDWDRHWHLCILREVPNARRREQLMNQLSFLGWAPLSDGAWVGLRNDGEVDQILAAEGLAADRFRAPVDDDAAAFARRVWRLDELGAAYDAWLVEAKALVDGATGDVTDEQAFAVRSELVHEWRKFLFVDPGLPDELLPADWAGARAAAFFDFHAERLSHAAGRFVDNCLTVH
ncbi:transcriptional regulator, PaaX family [Kribbella flavida DSM 17836]|uniref:Transcriptional regulator, PaaX family n=1 Tax=Kribbella flavida (strain DSM 17836 / JCM 10339 / NBRC 14399) TaxID=479435 RepID=D2PN29_KRIFD|nr:PaaX family transcriptional regulator C-terminal domain-containing protein [Kribbella flavida]ADB34513.1 transcriptional regulator, PaaX family [Kribbella flavida DSM 17836]